MGPAKKKSPVVCECLGVTEAEIVAAVRAEGLTTVKQVAACTDAGGGCNSCHPAIRALLQREARLRAAQDARAESASPASYAGL